MGPRGVVPFCLYLLNEPVTLVWTQLPAEKGGREGGRSRLDSEPEDERPSAVEGMK